MIPLTKIDLDEIETRARDARYSKELLMLKEDVFRLLEYIRRIQLEAQYRAEAEDRLSSENV